MSFEKDLVKLFIEWDVELREWVRDDKLDEFQLLVTNMYESGELSLDYEKKCRLRVVEGTEVEDFNVDEFRKYFLAEYSGMPAYASSRNHITDLLKTYMANHPGHTFSLICKAAKYYVDQYKGSQYLMMADNFILNKEGKSRLEAAVDDVISMNTVEDKNRSTLL